MATWGSCMGQLLEADKQGKAGQHTTSFHSCTGFGMSALSSCPHGPACVCMHAATAEPRHHPHLQGGSSDQEQVLCWPVDGGSGVVHPVGYGVHVGAGVAALAAHVLPIQVPPAVAEQLGLRRSLEGTRQNLTQII
jgi:hypothetical protein